VTTSPPNYPAQPTFLHLNLGRRGQGIGRAQVLQATRLSPPFFDYNLVGRALVSEGHESSKLSGSAHLSSTTTWSGGPGYRKGTSPLSYPAQPTFLYFQPSRAGSGIGRARVFQATRLSPTFLCHQPQQPVWPSTISKRQDPRLLDDYFAIARVLVNPPMTTSTTQLCRERDSHHQ
jgi:hypothetical protein